MAVPFYQDEVDDKVLYDLGWRAANDAAGQPNWWVDPYGTAKMPSGMWFTEYGPVGSSIVNNPVFQERGIEGPIDGPMNLQQYIQSRFGGSPGDYANARVLSTSPMPGYEKPSAGWSEVPGVAKLIDAGLSIAVPAWGVVSGLAKVGAGAGTGQKGLMAAGAVQTAAGAYGAASGGGGVPTEATDTGWSAGMGGAGEPGYANFGANEFGLGGELAQSYQLGGIGAAAPLSDRAISDLKNFATRQGIKYATDTAVRAIAGGGGGLMAMAGTPYGGGRFAIPSTTGNKWGASDSVAEEAPVLTQAIQTAEAAAAKKRKQEQDARQAYLKDYISNIPVKADFLSDYLA